MMHRLIAGALAVACLLVTALDARPGSAQTSGTTGQVWLQGAGATFPAPLYKRWIEAYLAENKSTSITYDAIGSGEGISRFIARSVDFGASDALLTDAEAAKVPAGAITVPGTAGMVVIAYNLPGFTGTLQLPRDVYSDIFAGKLQQWDDPRIAAANPGLKLPNRNIAIVARQDSSGTTAAFTTHLAAVNPSWRTEGLGVGKLIAWPGTVMLARGNEGVASRIKISDGSIGYVEYGFAKRLGLPMAALQNKTGQFVQPTEAAGQLALAEASPTNPDDVGRTVVDPEGDGAYPIVTYSWLLLYRQYADARKGTAVKNFVSWGLTQGQSFAQDLGYLALPESVAGLGLQALNGVGY